MIIVWNRSSKCSNFSLFPSNVIGVVVTGRVVIDCGLFWRLTSTVGQPIGLTGPGVFQILKSILSGNYVFTDIVSRAIFTGIILPRL